MIWLVIWVRFWVEWTFKYTQLPCHAFWEYLKIFFFQIVKYFGVQSGRAMQLQVLKIRVGLKQKIQTRQIAIYLVRENSMYISILAFLDIQQQQMCSFLE